MAQGWTTFREIAQIKRENMELSKQRMENMQYPCKECSIDLEHLNEREKETVKHILNEKIIAVVRPYVTDLIWRERQNKLLLR